MCRVTHVFVLFRVALLLVLLPFLFWFCWVAMASPCAWVLIGLAFRFWLDVATLNESPVTASGIAQAISVHCMRCSSELGRPAWKALSELPVVVSLTRLMYLQSPWLSRDSEALPGPTGQPLSWLSSQAPNEQLRLGPSDTAPHVAAGLLVGLWGAAAATARHASATASMSVHGAMAAVRDRRRGGARSAGLSVITGASAGAAADSFAEVAGVEMWTPVVRVLLALLRGANPVAASHAAATLAGLVAAFPSLLRPLHVLRCAERLKEWLDRTKWTTHPRRCVPCERAATSHFVSPVYVRAFLQSKHSAASVCVCVWGGVGVACAGTVFSCRCSSPSLSAATNQRKTSCLVSLEV